MGMLVIARLGCLEHLSSRQGKYPSTCRWFQDIDSAAFLLDHRHAKGLLIDVAIMCQNASPFRHQVDFADKLSVLFVKEHGASLQVASHLLRDAKMWQAIIRQNIIFEIMCSHNQNVKSIYAIMQVLDIRHDIMQQFRYKHGMRIKRDRNGMPSCSTSVEMREAWASGSWIADDNHVFSFFKAGMSTFYRWGLVLRGRGPVDHGPGDQGGQVAAEQEDRDRADAGGGDGGRGPVDHGPGDQGGLVAAEQEDRDRADAGGGDGGRSGHGRWRFQSSVDTFALLSFETMARNFVGLHLRTMSLWSGGIYFMAQLLSDNDSRRAEAQRRASELWPRILRFEVLMNSGAVTDEEHRGLRDFEAHFLWISSPLYREMLSLVADGHLGMAQDLAWRIFAGIYHEKGASDG